MKQSGNEGAVFTNELRNSLRTKRMSLGLTYVALGRFLGISWGTVRKWELGQTQCCLQRHASLVRNFVDGLYDEALLGRMGSANVNAYLKPLPNEALLCAQRFHACCRMLASSPELRSAFIRRASREVSSILEKMLAS